MPIYETQLWSSDFDCWPTHGIKGKNWRIFGKTNHFSNDNEREKYFNFMRNRYSDFCFHQIVTGNKIWDAPHIHIESSNLELARNVFKNLSRAFHVIDCCYLTDFEDIDVFPLREYGDCDDKIFLDRDACSSIRSGVINSSMLLAKCSFRKSRMYCMLKLVASLKICSAHHIDLDPNYSPRSFGMEKDRYRIVNMSNAITLAYSAIEELQLEPRPAGKEHSVKTGDRWNEAALDDLNSRLIKAKIDIGRSQVWNIRGSSTRIHRSRRFPTGVRQAWNFGQVRDIDVSIQDALVSASWLRSKCTTHKFKIETESITMYDVVNVQILARNLLLETCGLLQKL